MRLWIKNRNLPGWVNRRTPRENIPYICDFSRCRLNARFKCSHPTFAPRSQICFIYLPEGCVLAGDGIAFYCWRDLRTLQKVIAFVVTFFWRIDSNYFYLSWLLPQIFPLICPGSQETEVRESNHKYRWFDSQTSSVYSPRQIPIFNSRIPIRML